MIETSKKEIFDIIKAWAAISLAFALILERDNVVASSFFTDFLMAGLTVGVGFLFHELAHKVVAQKYGAIAEFRSFDIMLMLALALAFFKSPIIFAAPGAVMIVGGHINTKRNGKISVVGPITNLVLAVIFLIILNITQNGILIQISQYGFLINSWLALFNMIPFGPFDGRKVFVWNKAVWVSVVAVAIIFLFFLG